MSSRPGPRPLPPVFPDAAAARLASALVVLDDHLEALSGITDRAYADACPGFEGELRTHTQATCIQTQADLAHLRTAIADQLDALAAARTAAADARDDHAAELARWQAAVAAQQAERDGA